MQSSIYFSLTRFPVQCSTAAIALYALVDAGTVILQRSVGIVPLEIIITAEALAAAAIGYMVTKKWLAISPENPLG